MEIVHVSDLHIGCEDQAALDAAARFIARRKPSGVIATGDLTAVGARDELDKAFAWLASLEAPAMAMPGNHDTPYYSLMRRLGDPFGRFARSASGARRVRTNAWATPDFVVAPINTARGVQLRLNWALGAVSRRQVDAAAAVLGEAGSDALRIVASHHPLIWPKQAPIGGRTRGGARAAAALVKAGADVFLSGHLHAASAWPIALGGRRAVSVSAGTLSTRLRDEPGGFTLIRHAGPAIVEVEIVHIGAQGACRTAHLHRFDLREPTASADAAGPQGAVRDRA